MSHSRILSVSFGVILALSFILGAPAHAIIPHEHSDHHHAGESIVWQSLHAALRHEDKNALPVFDLLAIVGVVYIARRLLREAGDIRFVDSITNALRRGILPHRKFG